LSSRINIIDSIRGYCLVNIFINHITFGYLHNISPSNFGYSDSSELFVFLSGTSSFIAMGHFSTKNMIKRAWRRALELYACNLGIIIATLLIMALASAVVAHRNWPQDPLTLAAQSQPIAKVAWHLITLQQSVGFSMVLRLYVVLMIAAPAFLWLASQRWWLPLLPAALIWIIAGHFRLVEYDSLTGAPLMLTVLPWTLIFACGIAAGAAYRQGVEIPKSKWLLAAAVLVLLSYLVLLYSQSSWAAGLAWIKARDVHFWTGSSKAYQSPLRVAHALSLIYLVVACRKAPLIRLLHGLTASHMLPRLGRHSLPIFAFGAVFAVAANGLVFWSHQRFGASMPPTLSTELILILLGLLAMRSIADHQGRRHAPPITEGVDQASNSSSGQARASPSRRDPWPEPRRRLAGVRSPDLHHS
jgi:hypothetical protein